MGEIAPGGIVYELARAAAGSLVAMSTVAEDRRALARSGIPVDPDLSQPLPKRLLKSRMFWLTLIMLGVYLTLLILLYRQVVPDQPRRAARCRGWARKPFPLRPSTRPSRPFRCR